MVLGAAGVSRVHAAVSVASDRVTVEDLDSKNGTLVNGVRIESSSALKPGDLLTLGAASLYLEELDADDAQLGVALPDSGSDAPGLGARTTETHAAAARPPHSWIEALAGIAQDDETGEAQGLSESLEALVRATKVESAALLRLIGVAGVEVLASAGAPLRVDAIAAAISACLAATDGAGAATAAGTVGGSGKTVVWAGQRADSESTLCLVSTGRSARDASAPAALKVALRLLAPRLDSATRAHPAEARPGPALRFPAGHVRARSAAMQALYAEMQPLLGGSVPVLITGETGVGKEMIARALHLSSPRADRSFVAVNCAAIPSELLEAELFGVVRGAATGVSPRRGKLQVADGGVLLLDEIGDMPPALQAKLLRALQDGEVLPVGADRPVKVDVWVLSATNTDIIERVRQGSFRQDLYYRLAGATLHVPALRQRPDDIAPLVTAFLTDTSVELDKSIRGMSLKALATLERAPWPGNVRQLRHEIRSLALRCPPGATIEFTLLPDSLANPAADTQPATVNGDSLNLPARIAALEHELIATALRLARGNRSAAARLLGISRIGLYKKLRRVPPL